MTDDELTRDALFGGRISYAQPRRGYRVGHEAPILARFSRLQGARPPRRVLDLGAGAGAVGLCVAHALPDARVTLVESEPLAARLAVTNARDNGWSERVDVVADDVRRAPDLLPRGAFALVVSNPPWFEPARGHTPTDARRRAARMIGAGVARAFVVAARHGLGRGGRFCLAVPAQSLCMWLDELAAVGLVPKRLRLVHPRVDEPSNVALLDARAGRAGGLVVEPPLVVRRGDDYTDEARSALWGG